MAVKRRTPRFRGSYEQTIDGKGRVSFPAKFRETLAALAENEKGETEEPDAETVIVVQDLRLRCLNLYSLSEWLDIENKIARKAVRFNKVHDEIIRAFIGDCVELQLDPNGRLIIPKNFRDYAQLERDIRWVGAFGKVELWSKACWDERAEREFNDPELLTNMLDTIIDWDI